MAIITAELFEPVSPVVTADSTAYTADNTTWPTADGGLLTGAVDTLDGIAGILADVVEAANAADVLDAEVIAAHVPVAGGAYYPPRRPSPVIGYGYGVLPQLEGEGHGVVGRAGDDGDTAGGEGDDDIELALLMLLLAA